VPPIDEQRAIAAYLDRETARIDTLIGEQHRLVEVLRERRAGVIADAVTRGVDGSATGATQIGWLGPTPIHWRLGKVKHLGTVTLGKMLQASDSGSDIRAPYMRAANVQPDGALREDDVKEMWFSVDEHASLDLRCGDVVVVEGGVGGYGRAAYLDHDLRGWGFQNSINRIRPHQETDGRYLAYFLIMARTKGFIEAYCNGVSMPHLTAEKLNSMPAPIPPLDEQQRIAAYLDAQTAKIDSVIAETERFIELARERRSALVGAAVTGQIDVREVA
jgi:type I restriction enzyme, S subunit